MRRDDELYIDLLAKESGKDHAAAVRVALLRAFDSGKFELLEQHAKSPEVKLLRGLMNHDDRVRSSTSLPDYLSGFALLEEDCSPEDTPGGPIGENAGWQFWYEKYRQTSCARYMHLTKRIVERRAEDLTKVIDLGCGDGLLMAEGLGKACDSVCFVAAEIDNTRAVVAESRFAKSHVYRGQIQDAIKDNEFNEEANGSDFALVSMALHHLPRDEKMAVLNWLFQRLKPGGEIVLNELYGGFEGRDRSGFEFLFQLIKFYGLESRILYEELSQYPEAAGFGKEISKLLDVSTTDSTMEQCIFAEDWIDRLIRAGFSVQRLDAEEIATLPQGSYQDHGTYVYTLLYGEAELAIPLLYTIMARKPQ